jgi:hypothetical protein
MNPDLKDIITAERELLTELLTGIANRDPTQDTHTLWKESNYHLKLLETIKQLRKLRSEMALEEGDGSKKKMDASPEAKEALSLLSEARDALNKH